MNIKKIIGTFMVVMGLGMVVAVPSMAQQQTFAQVAAAGTSSSNGFTYTSGPSGGFSITPGATFTAQLLSNPPGVFPTSLNFTGMNNHGAVSGLGTVASPYSQQLTGGMFTLTSGSTTLLSGTFGNGNLLTATNGSSTASVQNTLNNVLYTGGTYFSASGLGNPGSFSISLTSVPSVTLSGGYINGFSAGGTGTFSATPTPEPASIVPFALGGLGLLGLIARKTRRTNGAAA